jgi:FtsZ-interacting cell division protein ZipA
MSLNDSSAIILIVGALAVIAFVIHGLWFSGKSSNRRLSKTSKEDQALGKAPGLGKVRIVTPEMPSDEEAAYTGGFKIQDSSVHQDEAPDFSGDEDTSADASGARIRMVRKIPDTAEINLIAAKGREYQGEDIADLCKEFCFTRPPRRNIYVIPESNEHPEKVVFALCTLKEPYAFPDKMEGYTTQSLAFYMHVPSPGISRDYFHAMRSAAELFESRLGGELQDNNGRPYTPEMLDQREKEFADYDAAGEDQGKGA